MHTTLITSAYPLGRGLAQAGIMNINERKRSSASARRPAKQYADSHFVHSSMDFVVKFVAANVSSCVLKTMLYTKIGKVVL